MLGMTLAAANRPVANFNDEATAEPANVEVKGEEGGDKEGPPATSMLVHLDNVAMHKRAPVQQAIADVRMEMKDLFRSYLKARGFKEFEPPCLIGAASEGGSNVFRMPYFAQEALSRPVAAVLQAV